MTNDNVASIVDGKLILSFPDAQTPVVWQMDLEKASSCALEVKEDKKTKSFSLVQKISDEQQNTIASFGDKAEAVAALMATSAALQGGQGKIKAGAQPAVAQYQAQPQIMHVAAPAVPAKGEGKKAAILSLLLIIVLGGIWMISVPMGQIPSAGGVKASGSGAPAPVTSGEPMSADDFLKNR